MKARENIFRPEIISLGYDLRAGEMGAFICYGYENRQREEALPLNRKILSHEAKRIEYSTVSSAVDHTIEKEHLNESKVYYDAHVQEAVLISGEKFLRVTRNGILSRKVLVDEEPEPLIFFPSNC